MADDKKVIDIKTRRPVERLDFEQDTSIVQYINTWKKYCKENNVKSLFVLTIDEYNHINWDMRPESEHHLLLAYATLDDLKREILDGIFPVFDVELDDEEDPES